MCVLSLQQFVVSLGDGINTQRCWFSLQLSHTVFLCGHSHHNCYTVWPGHLVQVHTVPVRQSPVLLYLKQRIDLARPTMFTLHCNQMWPVLLHGKHLLIFTGLFLTKNFINLSCKSTNCWRHFKFTVQCWIICKVSELICFQHLTFLKY